MRRLLLMGLMGCVLGCSGASEGWTNLDVPGGPTGPGAPGGNPEPEVVEAACAKQPIDAPEVQLSRLTPDQYVNTVRDLFERPDVSPLLADHAGAMVSEREVEMLGDAAALVVATAGHHRDVPCALRSGDEACARAFIRTFGERAFRRPVRPDEEAWLVSIHNGLLADATVTPRFSFTDGINAVAEVILQSPQFIYRVEEGVEDPSLPAGIRRLSGSERATRLSYALWNSGPDEELLAAANAGVLDTPEGVRAQAARLLDGARAHDSVRRFASGWLDLDKTNLHQSLEQIQKTRERFPDDAVALRQAMRTESEALFERAFYAGPQGFKALMTTTDAYVDATLAAHYGVEGGPTQAGEFTWVQLDPSERSGIFTRAAFLTQHASNDYQSPIRRGVHLLRHALCFAIGAAPADADNVPAAPREGGELFSVREVTDAKTSADSCQNCHAIINPVGFTLENYDAMGRYQTHDLGVSANGTPFSVPVDTAVEIVGTDLEGPLDGFQAISQKLAESPEAYNCMASNWFAHALDRTPTAQDSCSVGVAQARFRQTGDLRALVLDLVSSPSALHLRASAR